MCHVEQEERIRRPQFFKSPIPRHHSWNLYCVGRTQPVEKLGVLGDNSLVEIPEQTHRHRPALNAASQ